MKKIYLQPQTEVESMELTDMIAVSLPTNEEQVQPIEAEDRLIDDVFFGF